MSTQNLFLKSLLKKIRSLPAERIAEVDAFVDSLENRENEQLSQPRESKSLDFPVISVGKWPIDLSLRRDDIYGNDGR